MESAVTINMPLIILAVFPLSIAAVAAVAFKERLKEQKDLASSHRPVVAVDE